MDSLNTQNENSFAREVPVTADAETGKLLRLPQRPSDWMPEAAPLAMEPQCLKNGFVDPEGPGVIRQKRILSLRFFCISLLAAIVCWFSLTIHDVLAPQGFAGLEIMMMIFFVFSIVGLGIGFVNALLGFGMASYQGLIGLFRREQARTEKQSDDLNVAILLPLYHEAPEMVFGNAVAMINSLTAADSRHRYSLFFLSDTRDEQDVRQEKKAFLWARQQVAATARLFYRHRENNTGRKAGNLKDWITRWGANYDAMLVLDADSLLTRQTILNLTDELASDPALGLVQSVPRIVRSKAIFPRLQQFATALYGPLLAKGFSAWAGRESNYWGHNAIMRTAVFARCADLPHREGKSVLNGAILSHDFVEAALLSRAGWSVKLLAGETGSYEESPPSFIDYLVRDRRWCQGNLQHLGLIFGAGLRSANRFHMLHGAMSYIASFFWLGFLLAGALVALYAGSAPVDYFPEPYSFMPRWPVMDSAMAQELLVMTLALLFAPKLLGVTHAILTDPLMRQWGGWHRFLPSLTGELLLSALMAPSMMIQHVLIIVRILMGRDAGWAPQQREGSQTAFATVLRFHAVETVLGLIMIAGIVTGILTPQLVLIAACMIIAAPLSWLTQKALPQRSLFATPEDMKEPEVLRAARDHSLSLQQYMKQAS
ncbi:glucans biosynthesis glucosyltransferase MdoH [Kiloniella sp. b19]|uniref:glucans biosynthesis glucosyltransferase MdoH n=1 Tax=Kiloniella sp. GXU_MW_B19 TaxID=3141326 RepID=UPI0031E3FE13